MIIPGSFNVPASLPDAPLPDGAADLVATLLLDLAKKRQTADAEIAAGEE